MSLRVKREILRRQGFQLGVQALRHHGFNHQALCQRCGVVGQRRHGHGSDAKAGHQHHGACDQALAVVVSKLLQALRSEINLNLQEDKGLWWPAGSGTLGRQWLFRTETRKALSGKGTDAAYGPSTRIRSLVGETLVWLLPVRARCCRRLVPIIDRADPSQSPKTACDVRAR
jgi:hypothetical protein